MFGVPPRINIISEMPSRFRRAFICKTNVTISSGVFAKLNGAINSRKSFFG
jgi:hypothetical protein